jgi:hypothetical protein
MSAPLMNQNYKNTEETMNHTDRARSRKASTTSARDDATTHNKREATLNLPDAVLIIRCIARAVEESSLNCPWLGSTAYSNKLLDCLHGTMSWFNQTFNAMNVPRLRFTRLERRGHNPQVLMLDERPQSMTAWRGPPVDTC